MVEREQLTNYLQDYLSADKIIDYAPNGLQVEGKSEIRTIITGVTACQELLVRACERQADAILVHHGYFWRGESAVITGMKKRRLQTLLAHDINLYGYHLPLDIHPIMGNNVQLGHKLGININSTLATGTDTDLGLVGDLPEPMALEQFGAHVASTLKRQPLLISGGSHPIKTIAWCTGGAQGFIEQASCAGVDAYLTGEVSEKTTHSARELGIHFIGAGHHATERYGIQALGKHLQAKFDLDVEFIDIENPA